MANTRCRRSPEAESTVKHDRMLNTMHDDKKSDVSIFTELRNSRE